MEKHRDFLKQISLSLPGIIAVNFGLLGSAIGSGWLTAASSHSQMSLHIGTAQGWATSTFLQDFVHIATWNLRVMATIVFGVSTIGIFALIELAWIGFSFGMDSYAICHRSPRVVPIFLTYAPLEISAFTLSASATLSFSLSALRFFFLKERQQFRGALILLGIAVTLLLVAAALEANAHERIKSFVSLVGGG